MGANTTANPYLYAAEMTRIIRGGKTSGKPLFVYLALHNVHQPVESPEEFYHLYPAADYNEVRMPRLAQPTAQRVSRFRG